MISLQIFKRIFAVTLTFAKKYIHGDSAWKILFIFTFQLILVILYINKLFFFFFLQRTKQTAFQYLCKRQLYYMAE